MTFETPEMTRASLCSFLKWFDSNIGTDREINENGGNFYVICFELLSREMIAVEEYFKTSSNVLRMEGC
jgi:hypothetical protein